MNTAKPPSKTKVPILHKSGMIQIMHTIRKWGVIGILCWVGMGSVERPSSAATYAQEMKRAVALYDQLNFPKAFAILDKLAIKSNLTRKQKSRIYLYQGFCTFYIKSPNLARYKIFIALKLHPQLRLPAQTPPPLRRLVALERAKLGIIGPDTKNGPMRLQIKPQTPIRAGQSIRFVGHCSKPPPQARLHLLMRRKGESRFQAYPLKWKGKRCFGEVSNPFSTPSLQTQQLEYTFQILRGNRVLKTKPSLQNPLVLTLTPLPGTQQPPSGKGSNAGAIVGITLGVVAVLGGGAALVLYLMQPKPSGPSIEISIELKTR